MKKNPFHLFVLFFLTFSTLAMRAEANAGYRGMKDSLRLTIVAFGNSVTAERKTIQQVFAQRLPALLAQHKIAVHVINSGVPGSHSGHLADNDVHKVKHALDRLDTAVLNHKPDLVLVDFGINDAAIDPRKKASRIALPLFRKNMSYMISQMQSHQIKVVLMTPNARGGPQKEEVNATLSKYVDVIRELKTQYRTGFVDNYKKFIEFDLTPGKTIDSLLLDGVHPNDKGHTLMAEQIADEIIRIYRKSIKKLR